MCCPALLSGQYCHPHIALPVMQYNNRGSIFLFSLVSILGGSVVGSVVLKNTHMWLIYHNCHMISFIRPSSIFFPSKTGADPQRAGLGS